MTPQASSRPVRFTERIRAQRQASYVFQAGELTFEVQAKGVSADQARIMALGHWEQVQAYLAGHSAFRSSYVPLQPVTGAPQVIRSMAEASSLAGVAPMVALPGAMVEALARDLAGMSGTAIVSSEGDTFAVNAKPRVYVVEPDPGPGGGGIAVRVGGETSYALYASTGRVRVHPAIGHARAVVVLADHSALADAAASAIGMAMLHPDQLDRALEAGRRIEGVRGCIVLAGSRIGMWGGIEVVSP